MYQGRFPLLRKAYHNSHIAENAEFIAFCEENDWWLSDYALFMAIKDSQGGASFLEWDAPLKLREPEAIRRCRHELSDEICFWQFLQYLFAKQCRHSRPMPMEKGSLLSEISRFTLHLTVQIPGLIRSCSSFLRAVLPRQLQGSAGCLFCHRSAVGQSSL